MNILAIEGCTRHLGKSQGYLGLPVRDMEASDGSPVMVSAWELTPAELRKVVAGAPLYLWIHGRAHPPVNLSVGDAPQDLPAEPLVALLEKAAAKLTEDTEVIRRMTDLMQGMGQQNASLVEELHKANCRLSEQDAEIEILRRITVGPST